MGLTGVAIFRDVRTDRIRTLELQPAAYELLSQWVEGGTPESSGQILAQQLNQPLEKLMLQLDPLLIKMKNEGVLLQRGRNNTRYFVR